VNGGAAHDALFEEVHRTVVGAIIEVVGEDFYDESDIRLDSSFAEDIELESTEMLQLAEKMMETYEDRVDFVQWFADMDLAALIELSLRDLVTFITSSLEETAPVERERP
jgi:acyl carrier protein